MTGFNIREIRPDGTTYNPETGNNAEVTLPENQLPDESQHLTPDRGNPIGEQVVATSPEATIAPEAIVMSDQATALETNAFFDPSKEITGTPKTAGDIAELEDKMNGALVANAKDINK